MPSRVLRRSEFLCLCFLTASALAQQPESQPAAKLSEQSPAIRQSAINLIEEALAGTGSLTVPANRLAIEVRAFPILWSRSEPRARALIQQMAGEFAQAARARKENPDQNPQYILNDLRGQRNGIAREIAGSDAELALLFVSTTQPYLDDDTEDRALITELAAQIALHDPRRALRLAEQQLKESGAPPRSMVDLLEQVERYDPQAGSQLFREIVDHLKLQDLAQDTEGLSFAAALLSSQYSRQSEAGAQDSVLRALAEIVAGAALNSNITQDQPYLLSDAIDALQALVPSRAATLFPKNDEVPLSPGGPSFWQKLNQARANGDSKQTAVLLSQVPEDVPPNVLQQITWNYANNGDLEVARQLAARLEPWQRNNILQQAIRTASLAAGSRGDFGNAQQLATQITDEDDRATLLADIAIFANGNGKAKLAEEMLGEATSLVANHNAGTACFAAQLRVAQAYLRVKPTQAIPLLERSAVQIEQALSAAAQLDGFLPDRHSFEGSELILDRGFLYNSLLEPYALATAELASFDFPAARALANHIPLPEARLMTEIILAGGALSQPDQTKNQTQTALSPAGRIRFWLDDRQ